MTSSAATQGQGNSIEEAIFHAAVSLGDAQVRAEFLNRACNGDRDLRARVEALLAGAAKADGFFSSDPLGIGGGARTAGRTAPARQPSFADGPTLPRYRLLEQIGEGGCGIVYAAEQTDPVVRRVAVKVIKPGMDTHAVIARFNAERQALALMDHPNIARVLDAGETDQGRPFFVMELVRGLRITDYCEQHALGMRERLALFIQVCHAIQHAHQKGVVHRDIKPSNVLVTLHDGQPVPKVIDFGIAKAIEGRLTDATVYTRFHEFIGTPAYMSPEQAELSGLDVDTRSDIYSLGVLLYELLSGATPFDAKELAAAGLEAMRRILREQEPPPPSTRLTTLATAAGAGSPEVEQRRIALEQRAQHLRGDLDAIVLKCLEKDRRLRYDTASSLAEDLKRHLDDEPVQARPASGGYRVRKFLRKHRTTVTVAAAFALLLLAGATVSTWQALRATRSSRLAERAQAEEASQRRIAEVARGEAEHRTEEALRAAARADVRMYTQSRYMPEAYARLCEVFRLGPEWEDGYAVYRVAREARGRWNLASRIPAPDRSGAVFVLAASSETRVVIARGSTLDVHQAVGGARITSVDLPGPVRAFLGGTQNTFVAVGEREITMLDRDSLAVGRTFRSAMPIRHVSAAGKCLLLLDEAGGVLLLDRSSFEIVDRFDWGRADVTRELPVPTHAAVSPDGKLAILRGGAVTSGAVLWDRRSGVPRLSRTAMAAQQFKFVAPDRVAFWRMVGRGDSDEFGFIGVYRLDAEPVLESISGLYSPDLNGQAELQLVGLDNPDLAPVLGLLGPGGVVVQSVSKVRIARTTDRFQNLLPTASSAPAYAAAYMSAGWLVLRHEGDLLTFTYRGDGYGDALPIANRVACATREGFYFLVWNDGPDQACLGFETFDASGERRAYPLHWPETAKRTPWALAMAGETPTIAVVTGPAEAGAGECTARLFRPTTLAPEPDGWKSAGEFAVGAAPATPETPRFAALTPEGGRLLYWNGGSEGRLFGTRTGALLGTLELGPVAAASRDGARIAARTAAGVLRVYDLASGAVVLEKSGIDATALCFSSDGARLAVGSGAGIRFLAVDGGAELGGIDHAVLPLAWSESAQRLLALQPSQTGMGGMLVLIDTKSGKVTEVLERSGSRFTPAWFSDDGKALALAEDRSLASVRRSLSLEDLQRVLESTAAAERGPSLRRGIRRNFLTDGGPRPVPHFVLNDLNARALQEVITGPKVVSPDATSSPTLR